MYLLIDECCPKALVAIAEALGQTAQRTQDVAAVGGSAPDRTIFDFARRHGAVFVTINRTDFVALASYGTDHSGVIVLPSVPAKNLARLFRRVLPIAEKVLQGSRNTFIEITANGRVTSFRLP